MHSPSTPSAPGSQFLGHILLGGGYLEVYLVVLDRLLRATTKGRKEEKRAPPRQNTGYAYVSVFLG